MPGLTGGVCSCRINVSIKFPAISHGSVAQDRIRNWVYAGHRNGSYLFVRQLRASAYDSNEGAKQGYFGASRREKRALQTPLPCKDKPRSHAMLRDDVRGNTPKRATRFERATFSLANRKPPSDKVVSLRNLRKAVLQAQRLRQQRMRTWRRCWQPGRSCQKRCAQLAGRWWRLLCNRYRQDEYLDLDVN